MDGQLPRQQDTINQQQRSLDEQKRLVEEFEPAFEAIIERIVEQERRHNIAGASFYKRFGM